MKGMLFLPGVKRGSAPRPRGRWERGQGLLEFALVLVVLLLVVMGIIDFGRAFVVYASIFNAAREGTRFGAVHPWSPDGVHNVTQGKITLVDPAGVSIGVCCDTGPGRPSFYCDAPDDPGAVGWTCEMGSRPNQSGDETHMPAQISDRVVVSATYSLRPLTPLISGFVNELPIRTEAARTIATIGEALPPFPPGEGGDEGDEGDEEGNPSLALKAVAVPPEVSSGGQVRFTYTVTNTGDITLTVNIKDTFHNNLDLGVLTPGDQKTVTTDFEVIYTTTTNDVVAKGAYATGAVNAYDSVTVNVIGPALDLRVSVDPGLLVRPGETVTFTYAVENTGNTSLENVTIDDSLPGGSCPTVASLPVGAIISCQVPGYVIDAVTTNYVVALGGHPTGTVRDEEIVTVRVDFLPIIITEPLYEDGTVVSGTAEPGWSVSIRDVMSPTFPGGTLEVSAGGRFSFEGLPPLVAGHVIVVEGIDGYDRWDSALVRARNVAPIVIHLHDDLRLSLCHGMTVITGTAEPGRIVSLSMTESVFEDSVRVSASGVFTFTLPMDQPLQAGQGVVVAGYGQEDSAMVQACFAGPYVTITPQCGGPAPATITVEGFRWGNSDWVEIYWDGELVDDKAGKGDFSFVFTRSDIALGTHTITARQEALVYNASFVSPCPAPNLIVSDVSLATTTPISTYQPLDFRVTVVNTGTKAANTLFWVDIYSSPPVTPTQDSKGWLAVSALGAGQTIPLTITLAEGFPFTTTYGVWAYVDSWFQVTEYNEEDNVGGPETVEVTGEGTKPGERDGTATVRGETWVSLAGNTVPQERAAVWCVDGDGNTYGPEYSDENARYIIDRMPAGTYSVVGETWIDGIRYAAVVPDVVLGDGDTVTVILILHRD